MIYDDVPIQKLWFSSATLSHQRVLSLLKRHKNGEAGGIHHFQTHTQRYDTLRTYRFTKYAYSWIHDSLSLWSEHLQSILRYVLHVLIFNIQYSRPTFIDMLETWKWRKHRTTIVEMPFDLWGEAHSFFSQL